MLEFFKLQPEAFGLDMSDLSLKIISLKKKGRGLRLASFNEIEIKPGIIEEGIIQDEEALVKIIKATCNSVKGQKLDTKYVVASLPEEKSFLQVIQMPKMNEKELKSAIIFEAENYIPLPISEVYLDFQTIASVGDSHKHLDVLIVAMPKKIVNSYVTCLKKAGLIPLAIEVESEAIARALIQDSTQSSLVAIVDFGRTSTDFIIFFDHSIRFTSSLPISSDQVTIAISKAMEVDFKRAERIKREFDIYTAKTSTRSAKISEALEPVLENLVTQIRKYVNFYQAHAFDEYPSSNKTIEKILLCGGGANLKGLPEFLSDQLQVPVIRGDVLTHFEPKKIDQRMRQNSLSFATAMGLALRENKTL